MWRMDWCEGDTEEEDGHAEDGQSHGDVEFFHNHGVACGVGCEGECAAELELAEECS